MPSHHRKQTLAAALRDFECPTPPRVANGFPQLIFRLIAAVHTRSAVEFTLDPLNLGSDDGGRVFRVLDPDPDAGEILTPARRQAVIDAATRESTQTRLNVCAAFSPRDTVYVRPGTPPTPSKSYPIAGMNIYDVKHIREPLPDAN